MAIWFTSDLHLYHTNIITYCKRPFKDAAEMNAVLVENWNKLVAPEDTVYNLGDLAVGFNQLGVSRDEMKALVGSLHGKHILYRGNHDRSNTLCRFLGVELAPKSLTIEFGGKRFLLGHYPVPDGGEAEQLDRRNCGYKLCGHIHAKWLHQGRSINVGVDVRGFQPISTEEIISITDQLDDFTATSWLPIPPLVSRNR